MDILELLLKPKYLSSIGLVFDVVGVWIVAIDVVRPYKSNKYTGHKMFLGVTPAARESSQCIRWRNVRLWLGLLLLTVGFGLQIAANHV